MFNSFVFVVPFKSDNFVVVVLFLFCFFADELLSWQHNYNKSLLHLLQNIETVTRRCFVIRHPWKFHKIHRKTPAMECNLIEKELWRWCFLSNIANFTNSYSMWNLQATASENCQIYKTFWSVKETYLEPSWTLISAVPRVFWAYRYMYREWDFKDGLSPSKYFFYLL